MSDAAFARGLRISRWTLTLTNETRSGLEVWDGEQTDDGGGDSWGDQGVGDLAGFGVLN